MHNHGELRQKEVLLLFNLMTARTKNQYYSCYCDQINIEHSRTSAIVYMMLLSQIN